MKKIIWLFLIAAFPAAAAGAAVDVKLDRVKIDLRDQASLQRGAGIFVNYCLPCHSAGYMRYNRMGEDLGIPDELIKEHMLFAAERVGDLMKAVMPKEDARDWFGIEPPDLSLVARYRGPDWLYTYMRSFYRDDRSPSGWNNTVFPNVAMPHVLYEWQGELRPLYRTETKKVTITDEQGREVEKEVERKVLERFELARPGTMNKEEYDAAMRDLTNFLVYLGEPARLVRYRIGVFVLIFLAVFLVFAYLLKKEYWKDVH